MISKKWRVQQDGFENYSVWNSDNIKIAEGIVFAGTAEQMIRQLEWGHLTEDAIVLFKPKSIIN